MSFWQCPYMDWTTMPSRRPPFEPFWHSGITTAFCHCWESDSFWSFRAAKAFQPPMSLSPRTVPLFMPSATRSVPVSPRPPEDGQKKKGGQEAVSPPNKKPPPPKKKLLRRLNPCCGADLHLAAAAVALQALQSGGMAPTLLLLPSGQIVRVAIGCTAVHLSFFSVCSFLPYS